MTTKKIWTPNQVVGRVRELIWEHIGVDEHEATPESTFFDDLGADSLDLVELTMACEEEFNIEISDADVDRFVTVGDVTELIRRKVGATQSLAGTK
jgi:acyl carrier protein